MNVLRIAMWSGPRNISTAMMRSFEARGDTAVSDEPFYAAYLSRSGLDHPMRAEVMASQSCDAGEVSDMLLGPVPGNRPIWYQKHMTLHMLEDFDLRWMTSVRNAFLIREPRAVVSSYVRKRAEATLHDIGFVQQRRLFDREAERLGRAPPVVDAADVLANPGRTLRRLCAALEVPYKPEMLSWAPGRRATDGVWAPAWYHAVEKSTSFEPPPSTRATALPALLERLIEEALPSYEALKVHRLF